MTLVAGAVPWLIAAGERSCSAWHSSANAGRMCLVEGLSPTGRAFVIMESRRFPDIRVLWNNGHWERRLEVLRTVCRVSQNAVCARVGSFRRGTIRTNDAR
jgi:hypothetical protein